MAKPLREQFSSVILCAERMGCLQVNYWVDRDSIEETDNSATNFSGKVREKFVWWRTPDMFERYDTSYVIRRKKWAGAERKLRCMRLDLLEYVPVFELIVTAGALSLPMVVACGLVERLYNSLFGMITGKDVVRF